MNILATIIMVSFLGLFLAILTSAIFVGYPGFMRNRKSAKKRKEEEPQITVEDADLLRRKVRYLIERRDRV